MQARTGVAVATAVLLSLGCALQTGCEASRFRPSDENPLLGRWALNSGPSGCTERMVFTEKAERAWFNGYSSDIAVSEYLVEPTKIYAIGSAGPQHAVEYDFLKHDKVLMHGPDGDCVWDRM